MTPQAVEWARKHFERCWPLMETALAIQPIPTHSKETVWEEIASGRSRLWPAQNSVAVTCITAYPSGYRVLFCWLAAGDMGELMGEIYPAVKTLAEQEKCDGLALHGRRGWLRIFDDFEDAGTVIVKDLRCPA